MEYDAFICHASEDKDSFVRALANELRARRCQRQWDDMQFRAHDLGVPAGDHDSFIASCENGG